MNTAKFIGNITVRDKPVKAQLPPAKISTPVHRVVSIPLETYFPDCVLPSCSQFQAGIKHQHILSHQQHIIDSSVKYLYTQGGVGSAKSVAFAVKCVKLCIEIPENSGVVSRRDFKMLYKSSWRDIKATIKRLVDAGYIEYDWWASKGKMFTDKRQGDYTTITFPNNSMLFAMQGKNWSEGLGASYGFFWIDDAMESFEEMFVGDETNAGLLSRLRTPHVHYLQDVYDEHDRPHGALHGMVSSNPPPVGHWLHKLFGNKPGMHSIGDDSVEWMLVGTHENPFVGSDYAKGLMAVQAKMGRKSAVARRIIFGESIPAYGGVPVFPEFDEEKHVAPLTFDHAIPLIRGWDFGYHHPAVVFSHLRKCDQGYNHYESLSEVADQLSVNVWDLYKEVKQHTISLYAKSNLILDAGDRAGYRQSDSNKDNRGPIKILQQDYKADALKFYFRYLDLANSLEYMRGLLKKRCVCGQQIVLISPNCPVLIGALQGGYKYPKGRTGNSVSAKIGEKPIEDRWFADIACAWRYGAENFVKWGIPHEHRDVVRDISAFRGQSAQPPWAWMEMSDSEIGKVLTR